MKITLEMVDKVKERSNVSYQEAKEALEFSNGDVLDAIIYLENKNKKEDNYNYTFEEKNNYKKTETVEEFKTWLKDLIEKGNVSRIKIKKDEDVIVDVPVNAGIAAVIIGLVMPPILAALVIAAVATKITIEITMTDGKVVVVNKYISKATEEVKEKANNFSQKVKEKMNSNSTSNSAKSKVYNSNDFVYSYKVDFDDKE